MQPRVDFILSNPGHHLQIFLPVIQHLRGDLRVDSRLLSLCELRGMRSPTAVADKAGVELVRLFPALRRSPSTGRGGDGTPSRLRRLAHSVAWGGFLKPALRRSWRSAPDLVVLPNDAAFPYDRICSRLKRDHVPFLLVQEGIRFAGPSNRSASHPGTGGANAVAVWGPSSARFFRAQGVPKERIALTGCPRFDEIETTDWQPEIDRLRSKLDVDAPNLLFLSNPIDDLGYCDTDAKLRLFKRFVDRLGPLFENPRFRLLVKLHPRESPDDFSRVVRPLEFADRIVVLQSEPLYPLFQLVDAAVTFGSSAGLEALLFGLPLAVLEVPGHGYLHDFVSTGAATALPADGEIVSTVEGLLTGADDTATGRYLQESLATRSDAARRVADLVAQLAGRPSRTF